MTNPVPTETQPARSGLAPIEWVDGRVRLLDQSRLPREVSYVHLSSADEVAGAIREMRVRGAPAIGVTAAYGMALAAAGLALRARYEALAELSAAAESIAASRPTAVNLRWAVERMVRSAEQAPVEVDLAAHLLAEACELHRETLESRPASERPRRCSHSTRILRSHALQHGCTGHRRLRYGARRNPPRVGGRQGAPCAGHRDASMAARRAAHDVGARPAGHTGHPDG